MRVPFSLLAARLSLLFLFALPLPARQKPLHLAPIPADPLEIVTGGISAIHKRADRDAVLQLLARTRDRYALRTANRAYDLKVTFRTDSGGQTKYDGLWQMEQIFDPQLGSRWTAAGPDSYAITRISSHGAVYGDDPEPYVPLRLHEARAALFDPLPSAQFAAHAVLRTATGTYNGAKLTCVLLSTGGKPPKSPPGRRWDETEECIDPQSGILQIHSQVPGRYYAYDYTDAPLLDGRALPRKVTVTEGGKVVSSIAVVSLTDLPNPDPSLFVPSEAMKAKGRPVEMGEAQKLFREFAAPHAAPATICFFGVLTPSGELAEAHSLQPADPKSAAALAEAQKLATPGMAPLGATPQQHFVFIIENRK